MATWTTISDTVLEPLKPIRSVDGLALRDNPIAIAEGASGAPRIVNGAVTNGTLGAEKFQTGTTERDWVLARTAGAAAGVVGTYAFARYTGLSTTLVFGTTIAGSNLVATEASGATAAAVLSGTWRCMGDAQDVGTDEEKTSLWLRIS